MAESLSSKIPVPPCRSCAWFSHVDVLGTAINSCTFMLPVGGKPDEIDEPDSDVGYCKQYEGWVY